jgi:geranylgeranyl pyrophosphate synthase
MSFEQLQRSEENRAEASLPPGATRENNEGLLKESAKAAFLAGASGLLLVEERIRRCLPSEAAALQEISQYLLNLGGKRIRPLLAVLSARLFGMQHLSPQLIDAAAGIELIHMATLLHDDIIDESPTRRSKPSAFVTFGMPQTLLTGDFLLVKAFGLCARLDPYIIENTERACIELTEGEVLEGKLSPSRALSLEGYLNIISKKTASLFALAAAVGAHSAGSTPEVVEKLRLFGHAAGMAFQIVDDILDVTADEDLLGKPSGTDLKQRTPSLVNMLWLRSGDPEAQNFFSKPEPSTEDCRAALARLQNSKIIEESRQMARQAAAEARFHLSSLSEGSFESDIRDKLLALIEYTLERCL